MEQKSNTIPKENFKIPNKVLTIGKLLQFFSTNAVANFALKVFSSPPKFKIPEREEMMQKSAKNILEKIPGFENELMIYEYGFSKTKVLLLHGWSGRGTQLYAIADKLLENGMMVISFDSFAHGQSGGKKTGLVENIQITKYISEKYGPFEAAIGHSFGGITLLNTQAQHKLFKKAIVIGSEHSTNKIFDNFVKSMGLKPKVSKAMKKKVLAKTQITIDSLDSDQVAKEIEIPTYVIHDTKDNDVDVSAAFKLRQNLRNGLILITNGLGHRKILRDENIIQRIIDFIKT